MPHLVVADVVDLDRVVAVPASEPRVSWLLLGLHAPEEGLVRPVDALQRPASCRDVQLAERAGRVVFSDEGQRLALVLVADALPAIFQASRRSWSAAFPSRQSSPSVASRRAYPRREQYPRSWNVLCVIGVVRVILLRACDRAGHSRMSIPLYRRPWSVPSAVAVTSLRSVTCPGTRLLAYGRRFRCVPSVLSLWRGTLRRFPFPGVLL